MHNFFIIIYLRSKS